jgi:CBS domain containing-hemolysin-like protein
MPVLSAFERFKFQRARLGIVVDEYGSLAGIVTRTDFLEAIAGDIPDLGEEPKIIERDDGTFIIDGMTPVDEVFIRLDTSRRPEGDFHTLAGFALVMLRRIPEVAIISGGSSGAFKSLKWIVNGSARCTFPGYPSDSCWTSPAVRTPAVMPSTIAPKPSTRH